MKLTLSPRAPMEIEIDDDAAELLKGLSPLGWSSLGDSVFYETRRPDRLLMGFTPNVRKTIALSRLMFWHKTGEWLEHGTLVAHKNGDPLDYRVANLRLMKAGERAAHLARVRSVPPAVPEKGISELPNGQFKVRAYDPATKKPKYVGLRNTREEAVELKRAFLAGEVGFRTPVKVVQKPLIGPKPSSKKLDSDIFELPNGQFLVQVFDPTSKRIRYLGLPDTRKEAAKLKRAFLAASTIWDG